MSWIKEFNKVDEFFPKSQKRSGKVIDHVEFYDGKSIEQVNSKKCLFVFSVINPALSLFTDSIHFQIRRTFYNLYTSLPNDAVIFDLGYHVLNDSTFSVIDELYKELHNTKNNFVLLSSVNDANTLLYYSIKRHNKIVSVSETSPFLPFGEEQEMKGLKGIISDPDNNLFNYSNLGMQTFLNSTTSQDKFRKMLFDTYRMGLLKSDISIAEPVIRDSHLFLFDLNSVMVSDAPASSLANPTGFSGFEACRLSRYAGISEMNQTFCINKLPETDDKNATTSFLVAQMLWYFSEGWFNRKPERPGSKTKGFNIFITETADYGTFTFLQSQISDRWWLQIESLKGKKITISCLKEDYLETLKGEIPEKFIKFYQKIS